MAVASGRGTEGRTCINTGTTLADQPAAYSYIMHAANLMGVEIKSTSISPIRDMPTPRQRQCPQPTTHSTVSTSAPHESQNSVNAKFMARTQSAYEAACSRQTGESHDIVFARLLSSPP